MLHLTHALLIFATPLQTGLEAARPTPDGEAVGLDPASYEAARTARTKAAAAADTSLTPVGAEAAGAPSIPDFDLAESEHLSLGFLDGTLWGAGPGYDVRFDRGGFRFALRIPAKGGTSPELSFSVESVRRGDAVVWERGVDLPREPGRSELFATYALTEGVTERYEVTRDGVEQSYLFETLPAGTGDLVVRGRLETDLFAPAREAAEAPILFELPDQGALRYGSVLGIDADGRRSPGTLAYDGEFLELALPASFVDDASLPLLLDPIIGALDIPIDTDSSEMPSHPDVAFDVSMQRYFVVWQRSGSFQPDVPALFGRFYGSNGVPLGASFPLTISTQSFHRPKVANINASNRFLVAYRMSMQHVAARAVSAATGEVSNEVLIEIDWFPDVEIDVAGDPVEPYQNALVVWNTNGTAIKSYRVGVPPSGPLVYVDPAPLTIASYPSAVASGLQVTNTNGPSGQWLVTWDRFFDTPAPGDYDVYGAVVNYNGELVAPQKSLFGTVGANERHNSCAGDGDNWVVVCEGPVAGGTGVLAKKFELTPAAPGLYLTEITEGAIEVSEGPNQKTPQIELASEKYIVAWKRYESPFYRIVGRSIDLATCLPCAPIYQISQQGSIDDLRIGMWAQASSQTPAPNDEAMVVVGRSEFDAGGPWGIYGTLVEAVGEGGPVTGMGGGCGGSYTTSVDGSAVIGNDVDFHISGLDIASSVALFNINLPSASEAACGSCVLTPLLVWGAYTPFLGTATASLALPCNAPLVGLTLRTQWIVQEPGSSACPTLADWGASDRTDVTIGQ